MVYILQYYGINAPFKLLLVMLIGHVRYLALAVPQRGAATCWSLESTHKQNSIYEFFFLRAVTVVILLLYLTVYTL